MARVKATLVQIRANESTDRSVNLIRLWKHCEVATAIFVVVSVGASAADYEINFSPYRTYKNCYEEYHEDKNLRWITFGSSLAAILFVLIGAYTKRQWEEYINITDSGFDSQKRKKIHWRTVFEVILLCIFPYFDLRSETFEPYGVNEGFTDICYSLSELLYSIMWLRFYFILKAVSSHSQYVSHVAHRAAIENKVKPGIIFSFKAMFKSNPMAMIVFFIGFPAIIVIGMMMRVYERPLIFLSNQDWVNPITAVWFSYSTMMLGVYGDYFPFSLVGRLVNVVAYLIGTLFFVMIFVNMQNQTYLTKRQHKAFHDISLIPDAANVVKRCIIYNYYRSRHDFKRFRTFHAMKATLAKFKTKRHRLHSMSRQKELDKVELMRSITKSQKLMNRIYTKIGVVQQLIDIKQQFHHTNLTQNKLL